MIAKGNPIHNRTIIKFNVQSGNPNEGATMDVSSIVTKAAVAYTMITWMTRRLFNSCQNLESLLGFVGIEDQQLVTASYSVVAYESNNDKLSNKWLIRIPRKYDCRQWLEFNINT